MFRLFKSYSTKNKKLFLSVFFVAILGVVGISLISNGHINAAGCTYTPNPSAGSVSKTLNVPSTGTYRIWSRIQVPDSTSNSYYLQVDGGCAINVGDSTAIPANTWTWVNYQDGSSATLSSIDLTAGNHDFLLSVRENNVMIDRIILATDTACVPSGLGDNCASGADTTGPTVSLTAPTAGSTVSGSSVALSANASDNVGVSGVQFKVDGSNVGSQDTTSPYSVNWNTTTVANGSHTITAVASDAAGNSTTSSSVSVTVSNAPDTTAPTVSLTAPTAGSTVSGASVAVAANAADNVGVAGVQFKLDGSNLQAEDTTSPYSINWDSTAASNGTHSLTAIARDGAGNSTTSAAVSVTLNNVATNLNIGETNILASDDSGNGNMLLAQQTSLGQTATIQSMSFYVATASGKLRLGIYDASGPSGGPGAKKAETAEITPVTGWNTANVTTPVSLPAGTYWLAYFPNDNNLHFRLDTSSGTHRYYSLTYTTMPATFSTTPTTGAGHWSLYASLVSGAAGPKSGDINGDNSVNITDLSLLLSSYGQSTTQCSTNNAYKCDLSSPGDGVVNIFDLSILLSHYGT
jgi:hypothetical protein